MEVGGEGEGKGEGEGCEGGEVEGDGGLREEGCRICGDGKEDVCGQFVGVERGMTYFRDTLLVLPPV